MLVVLAAVAPFTGSVAKADYGLAPGTPAVNVAGQPVLVRATPGWDAAVSYELAADAGVTVWDVAQPAADGSLWYPIDGGFVPAEALSAAAVPAVSEQPAQDVSVAQTVDPAVTEAPATEWVDAAPVDTSVAPAETWVDPSLATDAAAPDPDMSAWVSTTGTSDVTGELPASAPIDAAAEWVDPSLESATAEPATAEWTDPAVAAMPADTASAEWIDPSTTSAPVDAVSAEWIDPAVVEATDGSLSEWTEPAPLLAIDPSQTEAATPVELAQEIIAVDQVAASEQFVELAQQGRNNNGNDKDNDKNRGKNNDNDNDNDRDKTRGGGDNGGGGGGGGGSSRASTGSEVADFALQFEGYPYVYAGEGPNSFDCSGFTMFVIRKTLDIDITHDLFVQIEMGQQVSQDELQPGDLVFFKNTFRRGLSHAGIYIGGGEFIHAENESTGVVISALNSDYYGSRWYGATRIG